MLLAFVFVLAPVAFMSETTLGRALRESLARAQHPRPTRGQLAVAVFVIVFTATLVATLKTDGFALAARTAPEAMAWFAGFDMATYLDVVAIAALAALALRLRVVWAFVQSAGSRWAVTLRAIRNRRTTRTHRRRRLSKRKSDDGDGGYLGEPMFA